MTRQIVGGGSRPLVRPRRMLLLDADGHRSAVIHVVEKSYVLRTLGLRDALDALTRVRSRVEENADISRFVLDTPNNAVAFSALRADHRDVPIQSLEAWRDDYTNWIDDL